MGRGPAGCGVQAGARRPHSDGDKIALLGSHPVHELAGEKAGDCIEDGKEGCDSAVVGVGPMEFRFDEFFVSEGKDLAVEVVDCRCHEEQGAKPPAPVGHQFGLCAHYTIIN